MKTKWLLLGGVGLITIGIVLVLLLLGAGVLLLFPFGGGEQHLLQESVLMREDLDADGVSERFTYVFPQEELGDDVFLQKTAVYEKDTGGSYRGTLVLEFENTGSEDATFTYVMKIPKSFAAHVRDMDFSVPPTEIIREDPEVSWEVRVLARSKAAVAIGAAVDLGVGKVKEKWGQWLGGQQKPSEEDAIAGAVMENVGDIEFEAALTALNRTGESSSSGTARSALVAAYPDKFVLEDCETIGGPYGDSSKWVCRAVLTEDWRECANSDVSLVDMCKEKLYYALRNKNCKAITDTLLKDYCVYKAAVKADWGGGCEGIVDRERLYLKEKCWAEVTQDLLYCRKIPEDGIKESCCRVLMNPGEQAECLGINATTTTTLYHPPTDLELLQETNTLYVEAHIYGRGIDREDGVEEIDLGSVLLTCQNQLELTWNGRLFSGSRTWEREESGRILKYRQILEGAVTEEGDKVVWLTCEWYRDDFDDPQATEVYWHKFRISDVPLNHTAYGPSFGSLIRGPGTRYYFPVDPQSYDKQTRGTKVYEFTHFEEIIWTPPENTDIENRLSISFGKR